MNADPRDTDGRDYGRHDTEPRCGECGLFESRCSCPPVERIKLFADTVARPMICDRWALMNKQDTGLASGAYIFASLDEIVRRFAVKLGERGTDKYGEFVRVLRDTTPPVTEMRDAPIPAHACRENINDTGHCTTCGEKVIWIGRKLRAALSRKDGV